MIRALTFEPEVGNVFEGKVIRIESFGAFVEIAPGKDGLLHVSQITNNRLNRVEDYCSIGDILKVRVIEVANDGKIRLSHKEFSNTVVDLDGAKKNKTKQPHFKGNDLGVVFRDKN